MNRLLSCLFVAGMAIFGTPAISLADGKVAAIQSISDHFSSVPTMTGEFIQFGSNGEQTGGKFYIHRPGRIRFDYEDPSPIMVVSNGRTLAVNNRKLKTWDYYPLSKTPLSLLLSEEIKIRDKSIKLVDPQPDVTKVVMGDRQVFGDSEITMLFDPESKDLRQWTIKDTRGRETSVMIFNVEKNVTIPKKLFHIDTSKRGPQASGNR